MKKNKMLLAVVLAACTFILLIPVTFAAYNCILKGAVNTVTFAPTPAPALTPGPALAPVTESTEVSAPAIGLEVGPTVLASPEGDVDLEDGVIETPEGTVGEEIGISEEDTGAETGDGTGDEEGEPVEETSTIEPATSE